MPSLRPVKGKVPNKYSTFVPEDPSQVWYQGGWTLPSVTGRPHMGPGNWVSPDKTNVFGDEKYRQHDLGYSDITNSYSNYNPADEALLRSSTEGAADYVGKGVFIGKKSVDVFNTPSLYQGGYPVRKKDVSYKYFYDSDFVPFREKSPWTPSEMDVPEYYGSRRNYRKNSGWYDSTGRSGWGESEQNGGYVTSDVPGDTGGSSYARRKDPGFYDRTGRSPYSEPFGSSDVIVPDTGSGGARGSGSGRKHDYTTYYEYS